MLLGSAQHQSLITLNKQSSVQYQNAFPRSNALVTVGNIIFYLLEPRLKLLLCHLQVLDVGDGTVQERNLAGLLVGNGKGILEVTELSLSLYICSAPARYVGDRFLCCGCNNSVRNG